MSKQMKAVIKTIINRTGFEISKKKEVESIVATKRPVIKSKGNVLLSYILEPFLSDMEDSILSSHTHYLESVLIADTFLNLGFTVDVIDYHDTKFIPQKDYVFFVSARTNFQRIAKSLNSDCIKIVHLDTAHWQFNNYAAYKRLDALRKRRDVALTNSKWVEVNWAIENADIATYLGNDFTIGTYRYANKKMYRLSIPSYKTYSSPEKKDYHACRRNYLWFGSTGFVHKGLDLLLEVFGKTQDYNLYICGPIEKEKDFVSVYSEELFDTENIHTIGWVDINSDRFREVTTNCVGILYPSCSEGQSGAVVACMQAGLIPIISYESGVDVDDFGVVLKDCSLAEITNTLKMLDSKSESDLREMAVSTWKNARETYTKEQYASEYDNVIRDIIYERNVVGL